MQEDRKRIFLRRAMYLLVAAVLIQSAGCRMLEPSPVLTRASSPSPFWGHWVRMDTGSAFYISDVEVKSKEPGGFAESPWASVTSSTETELTTAKGSMSLQSPNVIRVASAGRAFFLYRAGGAEGRFTGRLMGSSSRSSGSSAMESVAVAISNLANPLDSRITTTDSEGRFAAEKIIVGDQYLIGIPNCTPVRVTAHNDGEDIGFVMAAAKVCSIMTTWSSSSEYLYADSSSYSIGLVIENTGTSDFDAGRYLIASGSPELSVTGDLSGLLGAIEPQGKKTVELSLSCGAIANEYEDKAIDFSATDLDGNEWKDRLHLRFYRKKIVFTIVVDSGQTINGVIMSPEKKTRHFSTASASSIELPYRTKGYLVAFSGATAETGASYAFCGNGPAPPQEALASFMETGAFEPNDGESSATEVELGEKVMAYLHKNDADFYLVKGLSAERVAAPLVTIQAESLPAKPNIIQASCATAKAEIRYTCDGSEPSLVSPLCPPKLYAYDTAEYRFKAFKLGLQDSDTVSTGILASTWTGN